MIAADVASSQLARFIRSIDVSSIDDAVEHKLRLHVLDSIGAGLAGARSREGELVAGELWAPGPAVVWGSRREWAMPMAALVNGTMAHALEVDDSNGIDHSGAVVVSAAVAAASDETPAGEFLAGVLAGYEVGRRVLDALGGYWHHNTAGWHSTGTCGSFAAAAAASRIFRLDQEQTVHALGIAGSFTGGLWAFLKTGAMTKRLTAGRAAEAGVTAGLLARRGFTGPPTIFEEEWGGFLTTYGDGVEGLPELLGNLGADWLIEDAAIKPYPCCRGAHAGIDALLEIRAKHDLRPEVVDRVLVETPDSVVRMCGDFNADTLLAAQMSLPFAIAVALRDGAVELRSYLGQARSDSGLRQIAARVDVTARNDLDPSAARVTVRHVDGHEYRYQVDSALGSRQRPVSDEHVTRKFIELTKETLNRPDAEELVYMLLSDPGRFSVARMRALLRGSMT